jgi:hypothetical protein
MANAPSPPWRLDCPWCDWNLLVFARGGHGADQGSGFEAAQLGEDHALGHGKTWREFLAAAQEDK